MNRYEPSSFHPVFVVAAVAMAAVAIGLMVVVPAEVSSSGPEPSTLAATLVSPAPTAVAIRPARIDVVGAREQNTAFGPPKDAAPKRRQAS